MKSSYLICLGLIFLRLRSLKNYQNKCKDHGYFVRIPFFLALIFVLGSLITVIKPTKAQERTRRFEITVPVDFTAKNAVTARSRALNEGPVIATQALFRQLTLAEDFQLLPTLTPDQAAPLMISVDIANERTSSVRYAADMTVVLDAHGVRKLLIEAGVRFAETRSRPLLVLPVLRQAEQIILWDVTNPWLTGWANQPAHSRLVPLRMPLGDLQDVQDIGGDSTIIQNEARLLPIAQRYGVSDFVIATAEIGTGLDDRPVVQVVIDRYGGSPRQDIVRILVTDTNSSDSVQNDDVIDLSNQRAELLQAAAIQSATAIEEEWKRSNLIVVDEKQEITCTVPINQPADWHLVRKRLRDVQLVRRYRQLALTVNQVYLTLAYGGSLEQLQTGMEQSDLHIKIGRTYCILQTVEMISAAVTSPIIAPSVAAPVSP